MTTSRPHPGAVDPQTWVSPLPVATSRERLFLNRFGTGFTQTALAQLRAAGGADAWLAAQLDPSTVPEAAKVAAVDSWFATLTQSPATKYAANAAKTKSAWQYGLDLSNWSLLRRIHSNRSVLETMTDFWSSHLHIPVGHDYAWVYRYDYDQTIRAHALGTFEDLLLACSLHPAMRVYLDNWKSVRNAPNENQGRELLELHTVGRDAGYTEAMVKDSAKILSGYTVDWGTEQDLQRRLRPHQAHHRLRQRPRLQRPQRRRRRPGRHHRLPHGTSPTTRPPPRASPPSSRPTSSPTTPATSSSPTSPTSTPAPAPTSPPPSRLSPTHPQFLASEGHKVRTPYADLVATTRVLAVDVKAPTTTSSWANAAS